MSSLSDLLFSSLSTLSVTRSVCCGITGGFPVGFSVVDFEGLPPSLPLFHAEIKEAFVDAHPCTTTASPSISMNVCTIASQKV